ncbi:hypothetical protein QX776_18180 [Alteromonadaceae bacterium BrNp21-10]|nr:hypothetical protein [Alteromonadaceae bacterium BrNp21-10]
MSIFKISINRIFTLALAVSISANAYATSDALPSAKALFTKHIEAVGGEEKLRENHARTVTGTFKIPAMGVNGTLVAVAAAPNKMSSVVDLGPMGKSFEGYNGTRGWSINGMTGNQLLEGDALKALQARADFYADLHLAGDSVKQQTVEIATIDGEENYRVLLVSAEGNESFLFFSKTTGLLTGKESMEKTPYGVLPTTVKISDYSEFAGLKFAKKVVTSQGGFDSILQIDSVSFADIAENAFDMPAEIQALIK